MEEASVGAGEKESAYASIVAETWAKCKEDFIHMKVSAMWKPGFASLYKADAQLVSEEISSLGESYTPAQIVEKARDPGTELHKCFKWDIQKAAEAHWIDQARQVVCHLVIRETVQENKPPIRFFFKPKGGNGYQPTQVILRNKDSYQNLLASALRDLEALRVKYHSLTELEEVFAAIEELMRGKAD